jgi:hypothetical protein
MAALTPSQVREKNCTSKTATALEQLLNLINTTGHKGHQGV